MTKKKPVKLSLEILLITAVCAFVSFVISWLISVFANAVCDGYISKNSLILTDAAYERLNARILEFSIIICVAVFVLLFLFVIGDRLSYIRQISRGIEILGEGQRESSIPLEGNNELTRLAEDINEVSKRSLEIKEKERKLSEEKEQFIRALSHDIRTPLTSVLSYSEILANKETLSESEMREYISLVRKNASKIRDISNILIGTRARNTEHFEDASLLFCQLADEFEEDLKGFDVNCDLSGLSRFSGDFDVLEMRRIFDNLISNVEKYADPDFSVNLSISGDGGDLVIFQENRKRKIPDCIESYKMGIAGVRRIAHSYDGTVVVSDTDDDFSVKIILSKF